MFYMNDVFLAIGYLREETQIELNVTCRDQHYAFGVG